MIDSHVHLNHEDYINDLDTYIKECKENNVNGFLCVGWDLKSSIDAIKIADKYDNVYAAIGIHPSDIKNMNANDFIEIEKLLNNKKVIAIGEVGLDYYWEKDTKEKEKQRKYFIEFIKLANKHNLPIVVHSRDAIEDTYNILKDNKVIKGGVIHCYSANKYYVNKYIDLNFYFGIGGVVTFKNAKTLVESIEIMPLERILLETDSPYLTPVPFRGKQNHSKYLKYIVKEIARIKNVSIKEIGQKANNNFINVFNVKL